MLAYNILSKNTSEDSIFISIYSAVGSVRKILQYETTKQIVEKNVFCPIILHIIAL